MCNLQKFSKWSWGKNLSLLNWEGGSIDVGLLSARGLLIAQWERRKINLIACEDLLLTKGVIPLLLKYLHHLVEADRPPISHCNWPKLVLS